MLKRIYRWWIDRNTERDQRHGIDLTMFIEAAPLDTADLWPKLHAAIDLVAEHSPMWLSRMRAIGNSVHVRRIPGTRAMLTSDRYTILDPYLLADFRPTQIAASIVHEATHAYLRTKGVTYDANAPAREERACRASEVRFGRRLQAAGIDGAADVLERALPALDAPDHDIGVVVDWNEWETNALVTRIDDLDVPMWMKRLIAKRRGVLDSAAGRAKFGV